MTVNIKKYHAVLFLTRFPWKHDRRWKTGLLDLKVAEVWAQLSVQESSLPSTRSLLQQTHKHQPTSNEPTEVIGWTRRKHQEWKTQWSSCSTALTHLLKEPGVILTAEAASAAIRGHILRFEYTQTFEQKEEHTHFTTSLTCIEKRKSTCFQLRGFMNQDVIKKKMIWSFFRF